MHTTAALNVTPTRTRNESPEVVSWVVLVVACACVFAVALVFAISSGRFAKIFDDFGTELPTLSKIYLATPVFVFPAVAMLISTVMLLVQLVSQSKKLVVMLYVMVIGLSVLSFLTYVFALFLPLSHLIQSVN
ncbi:MAG: hypothetical protein GC164_13550 [Phycisphaera sp.]|nr:hypothetical protein [Phycisphaera sp.]